MKKLFILLLSLSLGIGVYADSIPRFSNMLKLAALETGGGSNTTSSSVITINAADEHVAFSFIAQNASEVTDVDVYFNETGDTTGHEYSMKVVADNSNEPSGATLGAVTATFNGPAADGWISKALGTATGALTIGTRYWVVVNLVSGTPDGTDYIRFGYGDGVDEGNNCAYYTAAAWTISGGFSGLCVLTHADGSMSGNARALNTSSSGQHDIYNDGTDYRQGLRFTLGTTVTVTGVSPWFIKSGTPGTLTAKLYEGSTLKATSGVRAQDTINSSDPATLIFTTPYECAADTTYYITFENSAGDNSNDYDVEMAAGYVFTGYNEIHNPVGWDFIYGDGADPTAYTVATTEASPQIGLVIVNGTDDFSDPAGGGTNSNGAVSVGF